MTNQVIYDLEEIGKPVEIIKNLFPNCSVFAFSGVLGAGKTTLIQSILKECGIEGDIVSPTFTYYNHYVNSKGQSFYHFDLYRIKSLNEFMELGFHELLFLPNSWAFIEWPEVISSLLAKKTCFIDIDYSLDFKRVLKYDFSSEI